MASYSPESAKQFDEQQKWFDNILYQREDHKQACRNLRIASSKVPRVPGMHRSTRLQGWQPVAVNAIDQLRKQGKARGCIIADVVGVGKTWVVIAYLLRVGLRNLLQL